MSISGSFYGTTSNSAIKPKITWSAEPNLEGNFSEVTATLSYSRTDSYKTYGYWAGALTINGNKKSVSSKYVEITKNSNTVAVTHKLQVPHNDDGTKTVTISASGSISGTTLTKTTISASVMLETIPRAASVAATDADIGSVSMVTIGKKSDRYTYTVAWQFGGLTGYLSTDGLSDSAVPVNASSLAFPLPDSFYYEIPDRSSDLCTLTCTTFLDGTPIGAAQQCTFTVRADPVRCGPVLTVSVKDVDAAALALTGDPDTFIRYVSKAQCTMTAQARWGAGITQRKIAGKTTSADTLTLEKVDTDCVHFVVRDSRGYAAEAAVDLDLLPYFAPVLRVSAARTNATGGNAVLKAEGSFYQGMFGLTGNDLQLQYQIGSGTPVSLTPEVEDGAFHFQTDLHDLDYTQSYQITVTVSDALSRVSANVRINPGIPVFDWGKENFRFNVPVIVQGKELLSTVKEISDTRVSKTGDTMSGSLAMGGNRITGLGAPAADSDGATKAYADGKITMCRLWENPNPASSFAAQSLSMDLSDYDGVSILYHNQTDGAYYLNTGFIPKGTKSVLWYGYQSGNHFHRPFIANDSGVTFESTQYSGGSSSVSFGIPAVIYGIKGITP